LRGNHEQMAIMARARPAVVAAEGGRGHPVQLFGTNGRIEDSHLAWLRTLPLCHDLGIIRVGRLPAYIQSRALGFQLASLLADRTKHVWRS
jgi:hypothetical protein